VNSWFTSNSYFNRAQFQNAFAEIIPERKVYRLFLASAGQSTIDRFVDFDIRESTWWGPHRVSSLTPASAFIRADNDDVLVSMVGMSSGRMYQEQSTRTDDTATAIDFDVNTKRHDTDTPNVDKAFGEIRVNGVAQTTGRMTVTPSVGELEAPAASQPLQMNLTESSENIGRAGDGKALTLNFRQSTAGQDVVVTGYEVDFHELGER
jgi:hypothetical protein